MKAEALMDSLASTLAEAQAERLGDTSRNVEADTLVDKLPETLGQTKAERLGHTLRM